MESFDRTDDSGMMPGQLSRVDLPKGMNRRLIGRVLAPQMGLAEPHPEAEVLPFPRHTSVRIEEDVRTRESEQDSSRAA
jgi:hypothetical protein